jgi:hypothetical protein
MRNHGAAHHEAEHERRDVYTVHFVLPQVTMD